MPLWLLYSAVTPQKRISSLLRLDPPLTPHWPPTGILPLVNNSPRYGWTALRLEEQWRFSWLSAPPAWSLCAFFTFDGTHVVFSRSLCQPDVDLAQVRRAGCGERRQTGSEHYLSGPVFPGDLKGWDIREGYFRQPKRVMEALRGWQNKDGVERLSSLKG